MALYRTGKQYAEQAKSSKYDNLKYSQYDCQAFCELVLKDLGVRQPSGAVYNWKGSNDIARHACSWIGTIADCKKEFGEIPLGAWAFKWDNTGNEKQRGYYDDKGNYSHIGIYVGDNTVRDSTKITNKRDGVGYRSINDFQRIGLAKCLDYDVISNNIIEVDEADLYALKEHITAALKIIEGMVKI